MGKGVIAVYSSSSQVIDRSYFQAARELCLEMVRRGWSMVYGAGQLGLMGECARTIRQAQGDAKIYGVIPDALNVPGVVYEHCDELTVTRTMGERKRLMEEKADAFIALPGGFGTLEEILEVITLKQLGYHEKPIVLLNAGGFYEKLIGQFDCSIEQGFARQDCRELYFVAENGAQALDYIEAYQPVRLAPKWKK